MRISCMAAIALAPSIAMAETQITFEEALASARKNAPALAVARSQARGQEPAIRAAGLYPNPQGNIYSNTHGPYFGAGATFPLVILGQIGAAKDAARAEYAASQVEIEVVESDVRLSTAHAYTNLWLATSLAALRHDAAGISFALERAVQARVEVGAAAEIDQLRARAEKVRAEADASSADAQATVAAIELGRFIGASDGKLRPSGDPIVPDIPPTLDALASRIGSSPAIRHDEALATAAEARASRERALARPNMSLGFGVDGWYPKSGGGYTTEFRAAFNIDLPIWNFRVAHVDRELAAADTARAQASAERDNRMAELRAGHVLFDAANARVKTLSELVPAAEAAEKAAEGAYGLGRSSLVAVLDAQRALVDARQQLLEARAARIEAWSQIEHAIGVR